MKSKTLRAMIGGSVAAVMALSISLPYTASAAANDTTVTKTGTSYAQLLQYLSKYNITGFSFIIVDGLTPVKGTTPTTKPTAAPAPTTVPVATAAPTKAPVATAAPTKAPVATTAPTKAPVATAAPTKAPVATVAPTKAPVATVAPTKAPVATVAPTKAPVAVSTNSTYTQQIVTLVNKERATAGLAPVSSLDSLNKVAAAKATDMRSNNYFSHTSPTYGSPFDMMASFGVTYSYAGENIAMGQKTPQEVMTGWMNSPGHRANILSANFNYIGVGFDNNYWVQEFIGK